jgi:HK97 family phage major capsid protein
MTSQKNAAFEDPSQRRPTVLERETKHKPQAPVAPVAPTPRYEEKALPDGAAPTSQELLNAFDDFLGAFEAFKAANDERLAQIETRLSADVVTTEKMERINRALDSQKRLVDELSLRERRPQLAIAADGARSPRAQEHKAAWDRYVRVGDASQLLSFERKSLSAGSDPDGGYVVPHETEAMIDRVLTKISPVREIATVRQIGASSFRKPMNIGGTESGWVGETAARPETDTPTLALVEFPAMELYAQPAATQTLLDDANVNIEEWLASEVQTVFAEQEGNAFVNGDGSAKPKGFLAYTKVADASWAWDKIGYLPSGADGAFAASNPADKLIDLVYAPKQAYRANGRFVMNRKTESEIRKFKDGEGNYIWQPGAAAGAPPTLLGYPVTEAEHMPDIASNSYSIAFGDFQRGYLVVDRVGIRVLRDPYSAKPYVLFYTTKRVGGGVQNFEAIKLLKFAAS